MAIRTIACVLIVLICTAGPSEAWFDETHLAIAKAAGYKKWYNAAAADISRVKLGRREGFNHYHNSEPGTVITAQMVLEQAERYDRFDPPGHLYGAIIGAFRDYMDSKARERYAENQMAYLIHYIGDLSMPLHHTPHNAFNKKYHLTNDGIINHDVLKSFHKIRIKPIPLTSEADLAAEVARIANLSKALGETLEAENRLMTPEEAYRQISYSASLINAVLDNF